MALVSGGYVSALGPLPDAELLGELPDVFDAAFRDEDRDLAQPLRS